MKKGLDKVGIAFVGFLLVSFYFIARAFVPVSHNLQLSYDVVNFQNIFMQIEPYKTNSAWFTNEYLTNLTVSGSTLNTALIGPCIKLTWQDAENLVLQSSTNLTDWYDIRVRFLGDSGKWFTYPQDKNFYRLRDL